MEKQTKPNLTIVDLYGEVKEVTDLQAAIEQADLFRGFKHHDKEHAASDHRLSNYWQDVYEKLLQLKQTMQ